MAFQSLYRRYRPQTFSELVGQEHVATALRNAVREERVGHAYLFSGPRGTGKTSTARILAKALNCAKPTGTGDPCSQCDVCEEITIGSSLDVIELDAASNNGVNEMRSLLERVAYRSAGGARKIYIIDEVHMLSTGASNALLKTLEEPPDHVVFVLATTDPHKVLPTIRSRTQHFEFSLLTTDELTGHLAHIAAAEGIGAPEGVLELIARKGAGSARDALSFLDQVLAHGGGKLLADQVATLVGGTSLSRRVALVDGIVDEDAAGVFVALAELLDAGVEPRQLTDDLLRYLRDVFVTAASRGRVLVEVTDEERAQLIRHGETMGAAAVTRAMEVLGEAAMEMRRAVDPRLVLEIALVRLTRRDLTPSMDLLVDRVSRLERTVQELREGGVVPSGTAPSSAAPLVDDAPGTLERPADRGSRPALGAIRAKVAKPAAPKPSVREPAVPKPAAPEDLVETKSEKPVASKAGPLELDDVILAWPQVLGGLTPRLKAMAQESHPIATDGDVVVLGLAAQYSKVHKPTIEKERSLICELFTGVLGRKVSLRVEGHGGFVAARQPSRSGAEGGGAGSIAEANSAEASDEAEPEGVRDADPGEVDSVDQMLTEAFGASVEQEIEHDSGKASP